jgi:polysaccharide export outer membrane protein
MTRALFTLPLLALLAAAGCEHVDNYVWYKNVDPALADGHAFHIAPGDQLKVEVWKQSSLSGEMKVRSDGFITLALVGDIHVAGLTPEGAATAVSDKLASVVLHPKVVVSVVAAEPLRIGVLGQVVTPGMFDLQRGSGILQALARAGGLNNFADPTRIFVVPGDPQERPIRFTFDDLVSGKGRAASYVLRPRDTVLVE